MKNHTRIRWRITPEFDEESQQNKKSKAQQDEETLENFLEYP